MGPPGGGARGSGSGSSGSSPGPEPQMMGGSLPLAALAMAGGGIGEGLGGLGGMTGGMLGGGFGGMTSGLGMGGGLFGGSGFGGSGPRRGGGGGGFDLMRTYLMMQILGGGDAPDPPARTPGRPGAPRQRSPLEELMRMERIRMLRSQQMDRAMRNRNAPQNQGSRFEFQGRPRQGNRPNRNRRPAPGPGPGRGRRGIRPTGPAPQSDLRRPMPPSGEERSIQGSPPGQDRFPPPGQGGISPADRSLRDSLMRMLAQSLGQPVPPLDQPAMNDLNQPGSPPFGRQFGRRGPSSDPRNMQQSMSNSIRERQMRVGDSRPMPASSGVNPADRRADQADLMADRMDNLQAMSPLQRILMGGSGMGLGMGMRGGFSPAAGLLGGLGGMPLMK